MTLRISQFAVVCGLGLLALPGVVQAQAPRYQSPLSAPNAPQPQVTLPVTPAITPNATVVEDVVVHVNDLIISGQSWRWRRRTSSREPLLLRLRSGRKTCCGT